MKELHVIVDLQFGSCGKGLFAGYLAGKINPDTIVTAWAPNAGHTYIDKSTGVKMVNICLPNGIVAESVKNVLFGPGTVVNPELLLSELNAYDEFMGGKRLCIHEHAAVVTEMHRQREAEYAFKIGSTMKGCGAALIDKISRDPDHCNVAKVALKGTDLEKYIVTKEEYNRLIDDAGVVLVEGAQGFSLGMNNGFYPYTTSRECTFQQLMVDCSLPRRAAFVERVYGVCRTYPIRVANRFKDGVQVGTSGPCYDDQIELQWSDIGLEPELTTVTKLPRRIFTFSVEQIRQAVRMNGVTDIFLNFANYPTLKHVGNGVRGATLNQHLARMINEINGTEAKVTWLGWGPDVSDVKPYTGSVLE